MTVSNQNTRMDFTGNGAVDTYSYTYKIFAASHLKVTQRDTDDVETLLVLDTDYTVTGAGDTDGGSITLTAGNLPSDYILTIRRVVPVTQETDFRNQGDFFPDIHEDQFDITTMIEQQSGEETGRTITLPETVSGVDTELPIPAALKWFRYNSGATAFELVDAADFSTLMTTVGVDLTLSAGNLSITNPNRLVTAGGAVDAITATSSPAAASLTNGLAVMLEAAGANVTTTPTFNLDGLGAKTIVKGSGAALAVGDIPGANYRAHLVYDLSLTQWVLVNPWTGPITLHDHSSAAQGGAALRVKVGSFTRDTSVATGTQAITGVGFQPKAIIFLGGQDASSEVSWGVTDGTTEGAISDSNPVGAAQYIVDTLRCIYITEGSGVSYTGDISSLDSDGFTISWVKGGSPTGITTVNYLAIG